MKKNKLGADLQKYLDANNDWFHNYRENDSLLYGHYDGPVDTSMLRCPTKEGECKEPRYDHFDGPYSPIECPSVKEIEKYVPSNLIPERRK